MKDWKIKKIKTLHGELKLPAFFPDATRGFIKCLSDEDLVKTNQYGEIIINHQTQQTSQEGIWASGDVSDVLYKQNNISAGDAIKAVLNIYDYLNKNA